MSSEIAISVRDLNKRYRLFAHPGDRIRQFLSLGVRPYHREFLALEGISFDIRKGEMVGVIGRNGAGKSTLLQLICGVIKPTGGTVQTRGPIAALLELGAGFNPEFTGRENVYFQGAIMGFTKPQMDARFNDIAAFADIGEFIDRPVRTYSSGMFVRLAFAAATHASPAILVVDEALAVGDTAFQAKCFDRIAAIRAAGGAILFVSHSLEQIAHHCNRVILLDKGQLIADGDTADILRLYLTSLQDTGRADRKAQALASAKLVETVESHPAYNPTETRWGDHTATIDNIRIMQDGRESTGLLVPGIPTQLDCWIHFRAEVERPIYGLTLKSPEGLIVLSINSRQLGGQDAVPLQRKDDRVRVCFAFRPLLVCGDYLVSVGIVGETAAGIQPHDRRYDVLHVTVSFPTSATGQVDMSPSFEVRQEEHVGSA